MVIFGVSRLMGCDSVFLIECFSMFQKIVMPLSLRISQSEMKAQKSFARTGATVKDTELHPKRLESSAPPL
jgi:hypothetical protein